MKHTEYIPPRNNARDVFALVGLGILSALFIWLGLSELKGNERIMGYFAVAVGSLLCALMVLVLYSILFCWPPYRLSEQGIELLRCGLVPWGEIDCVEGREYFSRYGISRSVVINLKSADFLEYSGVSPRTAARVKKKKQLVFSPAGQEGYGEVIYFTAKYSKGQGGFCSHQAYSLFRKDRYDSMYPIYRKNDFL